MWEQCLKYLEQELPTQQFNTWIRPLQVEFQTDHIILLAPNRFVLEWVKEHYLEVIQTYIDHAAGNDVNIKISILIGSKSKVDKKANPTPQRPKNTPTFKSNTNPTFTFDSFIEGKSNQLARAASIQVSENPGTAYNPLFIYGGVGLGKTHLMHAVGNQMLANNKNAKVLYIHSEGFVSEMIKALQHNAMGAFKKRFRDLNALFIDDIQFFANKNRSQEEFFHTFNALFESQQQIILSSDRYPKDVENMEDRLRSRFGWGLTVSIELPDLETRVAIVQSKAEHFFQQRFDDDVSFFIAQKIRSNIRELEGAVRRIFVNAQITKQMITIDFVRDALKDLIETDDKIVLIDNIQHEVAKYFNIRVADITSQDRSRILVRPRQIAMCLAKELTDHSLPEIGRAFGGRDHTTVLYATKKMVELREKDAQINEDYHHLFKILS